MQQTSKRPHRWLLALTLLLLFGWALPAAAQDAEPRTITDNEVNDVAEDLYCPVCESTPLDVCGTKACADWRELIRTMLSEGRSEQEIFDYFARQYGDGVLANPPRRGANLILWIFPIAAIVIGGVLFARYMQILRAERAEEEAEAIAATAVPTQAPAPSAAPKSMDDYLSRVEAELKKS